MTDTLERNFTAPRVERLAPSGIRELANAAAEVTDAVRLDLGQPMFATPAHIAQAGQNAIGSGATRYTQTLGLPSFREAAKAKLIEVNDLDMRGCEVGATAGGVGGVAGAMAAVLSAGDEVLIPDPGWPNYRMICAWLGAHAIPYPCSAENGFIPDLGQLEQLISSSTRMLIVNSPNNPTGAVYDETVLDDIARLARDKKIVLLNDECYDEVRFDRARAGLSKVAEAYDGLISVFTCSKSYAMTGWRIGYVVARPSLMRNIEKVLESNSSCPSSVSQMAGEAALAGGNACVLEMVEAYRSRRDLVAQLLDGSGLLRYVPQGAFYAMVGTGGTPSREFALGLLRTHSVSVAPSSAFGSHDGAVRISLASSEEALTVGMSRLRNYITETKEISDGH